MSKEILTDADYEKINKFLEENYPLKPNAVEEAIKLAKTHETKFLKASSYLLYEAGFVAEKSGIENLPVMLAAVWKMEKEYPEEERRLTARMYIGLLMKGEFTSASKEANSSAPFGDSVDHAQKGLLLNEFWKEL